MQRRTSTRKASFGQSLSQRAHSVSRWRSAAPRASRFCQRGVSNPRCRSCTCSQETDCCAQSTWTSRSFASSRLCAPFPACCGGTARRCPAECGAPRRVACRPAPTLTRTPFSSDKWFQCPICFALLVAPVSMPPRVFRCPHCRWESGRCGLDGSSKDDLLGACSHPRHPVSPPSSPTSARSPCGGPAHLHPAAGRRAVARAGCSPRRRCPTCRTRHPP